MGIGTETGTGTGTETETETETVKSLRHVASKDPVHGNPSERF